MGSDSLGAVLKRYQDSKWWDYLLDGEPVTAPVVPKESPPGKD